MNLADGFPAALRHDAVVVSAFYSRLPRAHPQLGSVEVAIDGECIEFPYRIYTSQPVVRHRLLSSTQQLMLACHFTRHHDGRVRERSVRQLTESPERWIAPYVVHLLGEYVIEIHRLIAHLCSAKPEWLTVCGAHCGQNSAYAELLKQRATSYWNEYHRREIRDRADYPAWALLDELT